MSLSITAQVKSIIIIIVALFFNLSSGVHSQNLFYQGKQIKVYPEEYDSKPDLPSPFFGDNGREYMVALTQDQQYTLIDVTVENTGPFHYKGPVRWKGNQLHVDVTDFPTLAKSGLHSEQELLRTKTITGRSIAEITMSGRPGRMSGAGFMAADEDIISVLLGDNKLVKSMGLTHPEIARTILHLWNIIQFGNKYSYETGKEGPKCDSLWYNGRFIRFEIPESKGWQYSIFNDTIWGEAHLVVKVKLSQKEMLFLKENYSHLSEDEFNDLINLFTNFHTGEMPAYYIMRYGFYEGHTNYRADPIILAYMFGLKTLKELHNAFNGKLYDAITEHHVSFF